MAKWPTPEERAKELAKESSLVRRFQRDYREASGKCLAKELIKGNLFSYPGSFKIYEAQSDAVPDDRIEGKVVLPVTDHGLRDHMATRLDADLVCTLHRHRIWHGLNVCPKCGGKMGGPAKVPGGTGTLCHSCNHHIRY